MDRTEKHGKPWQDNQDMASGTGPLRQDTGTGQTRLVTLTGQPGQVSLGAMDKMAGAGQLAQVSWDRTAKTR
jgi:hypothetical protein